MIQYTVKQGDTLTGIARQFGFRNFRAAGITSVPSGNFDLIRPDEVITLENYDPSNIQTSGEPTPPVISSVDNAQQFGEDQTSLENILAGVRPEDAEGETPAIDETPPLDTTPTGKEVTDVDIIDDPLFTKSRLDDQAKIDTATETLEADKEAYLATITTRLADIDAVTAATIDRIRLSAEKRIKEQIRINTLNVNRIKAYGVAGGAIFQPIQFSDSVTERERVGAEEISTLERERDALITEAETASKLGKSQLLTEKLAGITDIENRLKIKLAEIERESDKQYSLLRIIRKEKEDKRVKDVVDIQDRLRAFVSLHREDFEDMTPEEIEEKIIEVMKLSNLSYSEAFNAIQEGIQTSLEDIKTRAEIEKIEAQTALEKEKAKTEIEKAETERVERKEAEEELTDEEEAFEKDLNEVIKDLASNEIDWIQAYNTIKGIYGRTTPDLIRRLSDEEIRASGGKVGVDETMLDILLDKGTYF